MSIVDSLLDRKSFFLLDCHWKERKIAEKLLSNIQINFEMAFGLSEKVSLVVCSYFVVLTENILFRFFGLKVF